MNTETALLMCRLCRAAHNSDRAMMKYLGFESLLVENRKTSTQAWIVRNDYMTVVVFPGSKGLKDWFNNFKFWKQKIPSGKMHKGFYQASHSINSKILSQLEQNDLIYVTGHSLGGALATIFASEYADTLATYTFGAPRIYNGKAAKHFNKYNGNHHRCVVAGDPVPRWPKPFMNYRHVAERVYFGLDGRIQQSTNRSRWFDTVSDVWQEFRDGTLLEGEDHMLELQEEYLLKSTNFVRV